MEKLHTPFYVVGSIIVCLPALLMVATFIPLTATFAFSVLFPVVCACWLVFPVSSCIVAVIGTVVAMLRGTN